jgi:hypothetical protein
LHRDGNHPYSSTLFYGSDRVSVCGGLSGSAQSDARSLSDLRPCYSAPSHRRRRTWCKERRSIMAPTKCPTRTYASSCLCATRVKAFHVAPCTHQAQPKDTATDADKRAFRTQLDANIISEQTLFHLGPNPEDAKQVCLLCPQLLQHVMGACVLENDSAQSNYRCPLIRSYASRVDHYDAPPTSDHANYLQPIDGSTLAGALRLDACGTSFATPTSCTNGARSRRSQGANGCSIQTPGLLGRSVGCLEPS